MRMNIERLSFWTVLSGMVMVATGIYTMTVPQPKAAVAIVGVGLALICTVFHIGRDLVHAIYDSVDDDSDIEETILLDLGADA